MEGLFRLHHNGVWRHKFVWQCKNLSFKGPALDFFNRGHPLWVGVAKEIIVGLILLTFLRVLELKLLFVVHLLEEEKQALGSLKISNVLRSVVDVQVLVWRESLELVDVVIKPGCENVAQGATLNCARMVVNVVPNFSLQAWNWLVPVRN